MPQSLLPSQCMLGTPTPGQLPGSSHHGKRNQDAAHGEHGMLHPDQASRISSFTETGADALEMDFAEGLVVLGTQPMNHGDLVPFT